MPRPRSRLPPLFAVTLTEAVADLVLATGSACAAAVHTIGAEPRLLPLDAPHPQYTPHLTRNRVLCTCLRRTTAIAICMAHATGTLRQPPVTEKVASSPPENANNEGGTAGAGSSPSWASSSSTRTSGLVTTPIWIGANSLSCVHLMAYHAFCGPLPPP